MADFRESTRCEARAMKNKTSQPEVPERAALRSRKLRCAHASCAALTQAAARALRSRKLQHVRCAHASCSTPKHLGWWKEGGLRIVGLHAP
jgi:hypothetical protein